MREVRAVGRTAAPCTAARWEWLQRAVSTAIAFGLACPALSFAASPAAPIVPVAAGVSKSKPAGAAAPAPPALSASPALDPFFPTPVRMSRIRRVVLDPGHGGDNLGTVGVVGVREKALALDIARRIATYLRAHSNIEVVLTRDADVGIDLRQRPRMANDLGGDAFISLHANAHEGGDAHGMEVFFLAADSAEEATRRLIESEEGISPEDKTAALPWSVQGIVSELGLSAAHARSEQFALAVADGLMKARPGARFRGVRQAPFGVLKEARMPAIVLEVGYLTHAKEGRALLDPAVQRQFAQGILLGLAELDRPTHVPVAVPVVAVPRGATRVPGAHAAVLSDNIPE